MTREFLQNFKVGDAPLPKEVVDAIMEENGRDIEAAKKPFADYESIKAQLQTATDGLKAFDGVLKDAITAAHGRNAAAIIGALGAEKVSALKASKDQTADIKAALEGLKKDSGYLFESGETPPPYAAGTGTQQPPAGTGFNFGFTGVRPHEAGK